MIYVWNDKQLAHDLRNKGVSEKHKIIYLIIYVLMGFLQEISNQTAHTSYSRSEYHGVYFFIQGAVILSLLYLFYKMNDKGDGINFIERFICLSIPLYIRLLILILIPNYLLELIVYHFDDQFFNNAHSTFIWGMITILVVYLFFYFRMSTLLKIASGQMD